MRTIVRLLCLLLVGLVAVPVFAAKKKPKESPVEQEARALWTRAEQGEAEAQFQLAQKLRENLWPWNLGPGGVQQPFFKPTTKDSKDRAIGFLEKAAAQKYPGAGLALAEIYEQPGSYANDPLADKWLRHDAALGTPDAALRLGKFLISRDEPARRVEGLAWLKKAGEQGSAEAYRRLGLMANDRDTPEEIAEAVRYYDLAIAAGDPLAAQWKAKMFIDIKRREEQRTEAEAKAAEKVRIEEVARIQAEEFAARLTAFLATLSPALREAVAEYHRDYYANEHIGDDKRPAFTAFARRVHEIGTREGMDLNAQARVVTEALLPIVGKRPTDVYFMIRAIPADLFPQAWEFADYPPRFFAYYEDGASRQKALDREAAAQPRPGQPSGPLPIREVGQLAGDGIVIYVDGSGTHGLILALNEIPKGKPNQLGGRPDHLDGATGLSAWYLPSLEEWRVIRAERRRIEAALAREKGTPLGKNGHYWTSTQASYSGTARGTVIAHNWCYHPISDDERVSDPYNTLAAVRAMRMF